MSKDDDNEEDGLYFETLLMIAKGNDKFLTLAANLRKLYDTALELLRRLPPATPIEACDTTAGELLAQTEALLGEEAA